MRLTWTDPSEDLSLSLMWRYVGAVGAEVYNTKPNFKNTPTLNFGAKNYFDLSGTWHPVENVQVRMGVRNILDKDPPITDVNITSNWYDNGNTFPATYDALGRVIFLGVNFTL
jgi:outer membrane receptor protein involved in Fe transport